MQIKIKETVTGKAAVNAWVAIINHMRAPEMASRHEHSRETLTVEFGRKYAKIITSRPGDKFSRSVYCFVEIETGRIFKAASWKAPAKHARGNVYQANGGWGRAVGMYGAAYL